MKMCEMKHKVNTIEETNPDVIDFYWALNDSLYHTDYGEFKWQVHQKLDALCEVINGRGTKQQDTCSY